MGGFVEAEDWRSRVRRERAENVGVGGGSGRVFVVSVRQEGQVQVKK